MEEKELDLLSRAFFRTCAENAKAWREMAIAPEDDEDLCEAKGFKPWHRARYLSGGSPSQYESKVKAIRSAEIHLNEMGYQTTQIRSATPGTVSVRVANAGHARLCVRVPLDIAEKIIVLGFVPKIEK